MPDKPFRVEYVEQDGDMVHLYGTTEDGEPVMFTAPKGTKFNVIRGGQETIAET